MTQKLIESLEFSRGAGGGWCIHLCNSGIVTDNQLGYYLQNVRIYCYCNQYVQFWGIWTRFEEDDVRTIGTLRSISCTLGVPYPLNMGVRHGYKTIPREILCMTFCKLTGTLHIHGNSLNVHWKLFVQKFLLWSKSWLWCITSATFLWNLTKQEREGVPKKKLLFFWILSKLGGGRGGGPCPNLFGSFS